MRAEADKTANFENREGNLVPSDDDLGDPADALVPVIPNRFAPQLARAIAVPDLRHIGRNENLLLRKRAECAERDQNCRRYHRGREKAASVAHCHLDRVLAGAIFKP
jgi:hypothetical protein